MPGSKGPSMIPPSANPPQGTPVRGEAVTFQTVTLSNGWKILDTADGVFLRPPGGTGSTDTQIAST